MNKNSQQSWLRRFFASRLFLLCAGLLCLLLAFGYARAYYQDYQVRVEISRLKDDVAHLEKKKIASLQILQYVMSPDFVQEKARLELNMKKPGEHVVVVEGAANRDGDPSPAATPRQKIGNPLKWWYYFSRRPIMNVGEAALPTRIQREE